MYTAPVSTTPAITAAHHACVELWSEGASVARPPTGGGVGVTVGKAPAQSIVRASGPDSKNVKNSFRKYVFDVGSGPCRNVRLPSA